MGGPFKARQIIEEKQFEEEKKRIARSAKRLDEVLFGITWAIARKPESFSQVPGLNLYLAKTDGLPGTPALYIWFTFNKDSATLLSIEPAPKTE
jgi:hypothetical protein